MMCVHRAKDVLLGIVGNPKKIVRYGILLICTIVMVFQLTECFTKLFHPPITTHSHFELNQTLSYPAVTFCRNPPYNEETMNYYNLTTHPKMTNHWREFDFSQHSLDSMFRNMTYDQDDTFVMFALDGSPENIQVISHIFLNYGHCHTLFPLVATAGSWRTHGYSIMLKHDQEGEVGYDGTPSGFHVFIHEPSENFTEINMQSSGRGEYMYVRVYEEIEIKLDAEHFNRLPTSTNQCSLRPDYSYNECTEFCQWSKVVQAVGCTVPWMSEVAGPECSTYGQMRNMLVEFGNLDVSNASDCGCLEPCRMIIFSANVMCRSRFDMYFPSSQIYIYYSSKMITVYEECPGYDLNQFVADLGGSLGFLLGLSVLGVIGVLEQITGVLMTRCAKEKPTDCDSNGADSESSQASDSSADLVKSTHQKF